VFERQPRAISAWSPWPPEWWQDAPEPGGRPGSGVLCEAWCDGLGSLRLYGELLLHRSELRIPAITMWKTLGGGAPRQAGRRLLEGIRQGLRSYPGLAHRIASAARKRGAGLQRFQGHQCGCHAHAIRALPGRWCCCWAARTRGQLRTLREALAGKLRRLVFLGEAIPQLQRDLGDLPTRSFRPSTTPCAPPCPGAPGDQVLLSPPAPASTSSITSSAGRTLRGAGAGLDGGDRWIPGRVQRKEALIQML